MSESAAVVVHTIGADGVAEVRLEEREHRNTFTGRMLTGLVSAFDAIRAAPQAKVVIVQGYDNYFCCGGTQEELIRICEGRIKFTDFALFDLFLRFELPVIAAMQGHAIGGGLALGAYADLLVLGEECLYSANFMRYGFTPGMGATFIIPRKFGAVLGAEMLLTARNYHGRELRERGAPVKVVPKADVVATARQLARELADKPRVSLMELKRHLAAPLRAQLPEVIAQEIKMHETTFTQPEVRRRIETLFGA